jgi:hypothetical protein
MTWLRSLRARWARFRGEPEDLTAMQIRIYKRQAGVGCVLLVTCEAGTVHMLLDRGQTLALCDTMLETIEEPEPPAVLQ